MQNVFVFFVDLGQCLYLCMDAVFMMQIAMVLVEPYGDDVIAWPIRSRVDDDASMFLCHWRF
jgi:hypothetical protein